MAKFFSVFLVFLFLNSTYSQNPLVIDCYGQAQCSDSDGFAGVNITSGTMPYIFAWSTGATTQFIEGLGNGTYTVTVTDSNSGGSQVSSCFVTLNGAPFSASTQLVQNITCTEMGSATAIAMGGMPPYTYLWSSGETTATAISLGAGNPTVTATDNNGCTSTPSIQIIDTVSLLINLGPEIIQCVGDGEITIGVIDDNTSDYFWSGGSDATTSMITIPDELLTTTTYNLLIEDGSNCTFGSINVTIEDCRIIPTLGQWGIIVLGLSLLIFSLVGLRIKNKKLTSILK